MSVTTNFCGFLHTCLQELTVNKVTVAPPFLFLIFRAVNVIESLGSSMFGQEDSSGDDNKEDSTGDDEPETTKEIKTTEMTIASLPVTEENINEVRIHSIDDRILCKSDECIHEFICLLFF